MSPDPDDLLAVLNHPLRRRILRALDGEEAASPTELAKSLAEPLTTVSYHVRILVHYRALKLVRTRAVRGAVEHFYRSLVEAEWALAALHASQGADGGA
jgi:DNA-binding transcriptional ArsR family regulator